MIGKIPRTSHLVNLVEPLRVNLLRIGEAIPQQSCSILSSVGNLGAWEYTGTAVQILKPKKSQRPAENLEPIANSPYFTSPSVSICCFCWPHHGDVTIPSTISTPSTAKLGGRTPPGPKGDELTR